LKASIDAWIRDPPATLVIGSPDALRRILTALGELGLGRA